MNSFFLTGKIVDLAFHRVEDESPFSDKQSFYEVKMQCEDNFNSVNNRYPDFYQTVYCWEGSGTSLNMAKDKNKTVIIKGRFQAHDEKTILFGDLVKVLD